MGRGVPADQSGGGDDPAAHSDDAAGVAGLLLAALGPEGARQLWTTAARSSVMFTQALFNCVFPWILVSWAVQSIDAGLATILNSLSPICIFLLTWAITRHEPATARKFVGVSLGLSGVIAIIGVNALSGVGTHTLAELACVAGSFCYAVAAIIGRRFDRVSPLVPAAGAVLVAAALMIPIALVAEQPCIMIGLPLVLAGVVAMTMPARRAPPRAQPPPRGRPIERV